MSFLILLAYIMRKFKIFFPRNLIKILCEPQDNGDAWLETSHFKVYVCLWVWYFRFWHALKQEAALNYAFNAWTVNKLNIYHLRCNIFRMFIGVVANVCVFYIFASYKSLSAYTFLNHLNMLSRLTRAYINIFLPYNRKSLTSISSGNTEIKWR